MGGMGDKEFSFLETRGDSGERERRFLCTGPAGESKDRRGDIVSKKRLLKLVGAVEGGMGEKEYSSALGSAIKDVSTSMASSARKVAAFGG